MKARILLLLAIIAILLLNNIYQKNIISEYEDLSNTQLDLIERQDSLIYSIYNY